MLMDDQPPVRPRCTRNAHLPAWSMTASRARRGESAFSSAWTRGCRGRGWKRASVRSTRLASVDGPRTPHPAAADHCVQLFYNLSDPAMEDALYDSVAVQRFVGLTARDPRPDETTILHFRHLLERHQLGEELRAEITQHLATQGLRLREGTMWRSDPRRAGSTKNRAQARDPEMLR